MYAEVSRWLTCCPRPMISAIMIASGLAALAVRGAEAQWTRVDAVEHFDVPSLFAIGDTIVAGVDTAVYVSTNAGASWQLSSRVSPQTTTVSSVWVRDGQLFAGTYGQGVFVSSNLGSSWSPLNGGLSGGPLGSLYINDFASRGDSMLVATDGAGVWALDLANLVAWQPFGNAPQANQAGSVQEFGSAGIRLVIGGGANGLVFWNDTGMPDWTVSYLDNQGLVPGLMPTAVTWTGIRWMVATNLGCYRSLSGSGDWEHVGPNLGQTFEGRFASRKPLLYAAINKNSNVHFYATGDDGSSWHLLETLPAYVYELAIVGTVMYAARTDGLWVRSIATVSVPEEAPVDGLEFARDGPNPGRGHVRLRWSLPVRALVYLEVYDVHGRRVMRLLEREMDAGPHRMTWKLKLAAGVYLVRLSALGRTETLKSVWVE